MKSTHGVQQWVLVGVLGAAVLGSTLAIARRGGDYAFFDPLIEIKTYITKRYVEEPDEDALQTGAINGMIEALGDPHTIYVPPTDTRDFQKDLTGEYVGIGAMITIQDDWLTIVSPLEDSPAFRVGLMPDDRVIEIEGESTHGLTTQECADRLMGEPGTEVHITVERDGEKLPFTIVRQHIVTRTVKGVHRGGANGDWGYIIDSDRQIAYLRLTQFTPTASTEIRQALESAGAGEGGSEGFGGLILDLRFNQGGVLGEAIAIADMFLDHGVIVSTRGRAHPEQVVRATKPGTLGDFPLVVMVNGYSASASEVLAGALVENDRAVVLGSRSYGKGSVQSVVNLRSKRGAQLKITEQGYYLPSGRSIQRKDDSTQWGVDPSPGFYVPMTDEQTVAMLDAWREADVIHNDGKADADANGAHWEDPAWIEQDRKDVQLAAALRAMQAKLDTGEWEQTGGQGIAGDEIALDELRRIELARERMLRELTRIDRRIETLQLAAPEEPQAIDLWPDGVDLTGGRLDVYDAEGALVATLRVTGDDLEQWLIDADVEPETPPEESPD